MEEALAFPPWLDLPEPLAELVLERLPLVDYIRFAAVCPKWRSIQRGHRLRHAPPPPPMANQLPWLAPLHLIPHGEFSSPSDQRSYRLPIPSSLHNCRCLASCHGWLLLLQDRFGPNEPIFKHPFLFNPITTAQILLPPPPLTPFRKDSKIVGALSAPPTDPDCIVLLVFDSRAFLYRPNNDHCATDWTVINLLAFQGLLFGGTATYCGGKFYYSCNGGYKLHVIDPSLQKAASLLVMRYPYGVSNDDTISLQEICGELFSVRMLYTLYGPKQFRVFKADLSVQEWVSVQTLGDHALFYFDDCSMFLLAADVGCKRNSIYACRCIWRDAELGDDLFAWGSFDLGSGSWNDEDTLTMHGVFGPWFLPTLDSVNLAKAND